MSGEKLFGEKLSSEKILNGQLSSEKLSVINYHVKNCRGEILTG